MSLLEKRSATWEHSYSMATQNKKASQPQTCPPFFLSCISGLSKGKMGSFVLICKLKDTAILLE